MHLLKYIGTVSSSFLRSLGFLLILLIASNNGHSQNLNIDSLKKVWNDESRADTIRVKAIHKIAWDGYMSNQPDSAFYYAQLQYDFSERKGLMRAMAGALNTQGVSLYYRSEYEKALDYHTRSLKIKQEINDQKGMVSSLNNIGMAHELQSHYVEALDYYGQSLDLAEEIDHKRGAANALNNIAIVYKFQGQYAKAIDNHIRSLKLKEEIGYKRGMISSLSNIGTVYYDQGDFRRALEQYMRGLKIAEELEDKLRIFKLLGNIGNVHIEQGNIENGLKYHSESLKIANELDNKHGMSIGLNDIGLIYDEKGDYEKALDYYQQSLKIREEIGDKNGSIYPLGNIGNVYKSLGDYSKALEYQNRSLAIANEVGSKIGIAKSLNNMGLIYTAQKSDVKAIQYSSEALTAAQEIGALLEIRAAASNLHQAYKHNGNHKRSLDMYELYIDMRDSIVNMEVQKEVIRQEFKYNYEKQAITDSIEFANQRELEILTLEAKQDKERYAWLSGITLLLIFFGVYFRIRMIKRQAEREVLLQEIKLLKAEKHIDLTKAISNNGDSQLDKEKIETAINNPLNPSDWKILNALYQNPAIGNKEIADVVSLSIEGVRSSLKKMYSFFVIEKTANQRVVLVLEAAKLSNPILSQE